MQTALEASKLSVFRGDNRLCKDVAFRLTSGEMLVIEGPNGSGKTSLLRAIAGFLPVEVGRISWQGNNVRDDLAAFRRCFIYLGHVDALHPNLTVAENLEFSVRSRGSAPRIAVADALERVGLRGYGEETPVRLSAGQLRRCSLARLLLEPATLWLLDEPLAALDVAGKEIVNKLLREHLDAGGLAVVVTHEPLAPNRIPTRTLRMNEAPIAASITVPVHADNTGD